MTKKRSVGQSVATAKKKSLRTRAPKAPPAKSIRPPRPSVRTLVAETGRFKAEIKRERDARIQAYITKRAKRAKVVEIAAELGILAEGDSWFDYPRILGTGGSIIDHLQTKINTLMLNLAHHGDEVRQMLSLPQREEITRRLVDGIPNEARPFDILLFSGGGNDLVGDQFCIWLKKFQAGMSAPDIIDTGRFECVLGIVEAGYRDIIEIRNTESPKTAIYLHTYDFAIPDGRPACGVGPWLKPSLDFRGVPASLQRDVVKDMLLRFGKRIHQVAGNYTNVFVVPTQGTLSNDEWSNEIHPDRTGFDKLADRFAAALGSKFPSI
jgi:hypothetical protein